MSDLTLKFSMPEDEYEAQQALDAMRLRGLVDDWSNHLRSKTKYGDGKPVSWDEVRDDWARFLMEAAL